MPLENAALSPLVCTLSEGSGTEFVIWFTSRKK